jgi:DNA-binding NarL/FixJ family response regulator
MDVASWPPPARPSGSARTTRAAISHHESQIAGLESEGPTRPEIGAKLFLRPGTTEWHLRQVYPKLGISSRRELRTVLRAS